MATYKHPLSSVKIASPCSADWEDMIGGDLRRFCGQCELNVYNLSDMTKRDAEQLINQAEGRLCVRFFKRSDGTILTRDCPVGLKAIRKRFSRLRTAIVSSVLSFFAGVGVHVAAVETGSFTRNIGEFPQTEVMGVMAQEPPNRGTVPSSPAKSELDGHESRSQAPRRLKSKLKAQR